MAIKVTNELYTYKDDSGAPAFGEPLYVRSHTNDSLVRLEYDGRKFVVNAKDLRAAIENATNTRLV